MEGVGEPGLVVKGAGSPHTYSMRPSEAAMLQNADVVFWVGHDLEPFLEGPLENIAGSAKTVELLDAHDLVKLEFREGGAFDEHDHDHGDHGDEHAHDEHGHDDHDHAEHGHDDHADHDHGHDHAKKTEAAHDHDHEHSHDDHGHEHAEHDHDHAKKTPAFKLLVFNSLCFGTIIYVFCLSIRKRAVMLKHHIKIS
ncbi:MAG: zinc ABC transporter substrate-binding protein, partial [Pseudomonadota bacterium]